jgi:hypothetical protein
MLDNNKKQVRPIKKETIYTKYIKKQEQEKFKLRENIISVDLRKKLAETLHSSARA